MAWETGMYLLAGGQEGDYWITLNGGVYSGPQFTLAVSYYPGQYSVTEEFLTFNYRVKQENGIWSYLVSVKNTGTKGAWFKFTGGGF
jgi:hypothetical protein